MVNSPTAPYFGSYEGSDIVNGEYRLFISCPNVDVLEEKLRPWWQGLPWAGELSLLKRYGEMHDSSAPEKPVVLGHRN